MALSRQTSLSALTIHFATEDIKNEDGSVAVKKGAIKNCQIEMSSFIEEDGVVVPGTHQRVTASESDLSKIPELSNKAVDTIARLAARGQDTGKVIEQIRNRVAKAESDSKIQKDRGDQLESELQVLRENLDAALAEIQTHKVRADELHLRLVSATAEVEALRSVRASLDSDSSAPGRIDPGS